MIWHSIRIRCVLATLTAILPCATHAEVLTADLDGNGKQEIVIANIAPFNPVIGNAGNSYVFIINPTGSIRRKICWSNGSNATICPAVVDTAK